MSRHDFWRQSGGHQRARRRCDARLPADLDIREAHDAFEIVEHADAGGGPGVESGQRFSAQEIRETEEQRGANDIRREGYAVIMGY